MKPSRPRWKLFLILLAVPWLLRWILSFTPAEGAGLGGAASVLAVALTLLLAVIWLLLLSRLPWVERLFGFLTVALIATVLGFCVRIEGHMGDFFPQLTWVWSPSSEELADDLKPLSAGGAAAASITTDSPSDFPRFLGPNESNWISGSQLAADWATTTPKELWRRDIGLGWSSFSVAGPYAYTMEQRGEDEITVCYEARTGNPIWSHREKARFVESMGGIGPRSTPTIHDGRVYALGATGILLCLDAATGEVQWRRDTLEEAGHNNLQWAKSSSPLIVDDLVVITLGDPDRDDDEGSLAAYDRLLGDLKWQAGSERPAYASPILTTLDGQSQILDFHSTGIQGHAPATGEVLWSHDIGRAPAHNASPLVIGTQQVLIGVGYGRGSHLLEISGTEGPQTVTEVWRSNRMKPKFADMVLWENHIYGLDEGRFVCLRLEDGKRAWRGTRFKHGQILGVGDKVLIQAESGEIAVAEASPEKETIVHTFDALSGKTWNHPVLAGRLLLVRNDREAIVFEYPGNASGDVLPVEDDA